MADIENLIAQMTLNEKIIIGASSQDIRLTAKSMLAASPKCRDTRLHTGLALRVILDDPSGYTGFAKYFREWIKTRELQNILNMTIDKIATHVPNIVTPEKLSALVDVLANA